MNFKGFSSQHITHGFDTRVVDTVLIKNDLENHFSIRKGEVRGRPQFGTTIHNYIGKPFDDLNQLNITEDVKLVLNSDPRIKVGTLSISSTVDSLTFVARITYVETNENELWNILVKNDGGVSIT